MEMPPPEPRPTWRGRIHLAAFALSIPAGLALVLLSQGASAHVGAAIFAVSLAGLFGVSAIYHTGNWTPNVRARLRRMDHAMIFVLIAGSYTPITLLALQPAWGISLLAIVWTVAVIGVTLALARFGALHRAGGYLYIGMGWIVVMALPAVVTSLSPSELALLFAGGVLYTVGAIGLRLHRPNPRPLVFGYHEVWHAMTVAAAACHFTLVAMLVRA
ncbi:MAG TPA: hemolysin III family protein [Acidimicrobiia bacterium]|nr:hemolysin III family protein [Acidimicrobiia bacterium]